MISVVLTLCRVDQGQENVVNRTVLQVSCANGAALTA